MQTRVYSCMSIIVIVILGLLFSSCYRVPDRTQNNQTVVQTDITVDRSDTISGVPDKLIIKPDLSALEYPASASTIQVKYIEFDSEMLRAALMDYPVTEKKAIAQGIQWIAEQSESAEYLNILDGGRSSRLDLKDLEGFQYLLLNKKPLDPSMFDVQNLLAISVDGSDQFRTQLISPWMDISSYSREKDLSFSQQAEVRQMVTEKLNELSIPGLSLYDAYAIDAAELKNHFSMYLEHMESDIKNMEDAEMKRAESKKHDSWTQSPPDFTNSERYIFFYQQVFDGLPVSVNSWPALGASTAASPMRYESLLSVQVDQRGLFDLQASRLYQPGERSEKMPLITPRQALQPIIDIYDQTLKLATWTVTHIAIRYVPAASPSQMILTPAWMYVLQRETQPDKPVNLTTVVIDAFTGEMLSSWRGSES